MSTAVRHLESGEINMKIIGISLLILLGIVAAVILFYCVAALFVNPRKEYDRNSRFYRALLDGATAFILWLLRVHIHTAGLERVPQNTRCLYVCNHRSNYDSIVTWRVFRKEQLAYLSKESNFKVFAFGRIIRKCCFMAINRESAREAMRTMNRAAELLSRQEVSIGVYPEGTRSKTKDLLPFHNGVFKIAQKADAPVVVLAIRGTEAIVHNLPFRASHVYLEVVDVIMPEEIRGVRSRVVGERARQAIAQWLEEREGTTV